MSEDHVTKGEKTRRLILETAARIASVEGLEGLTIGRLAAELAMSKSGLFAHFGSKEELQLATVETAREMFVEAVVRPALEAPRGIPRLRTLCDTWADYAHGRLFPGGCFFAAAAAEFDGRPGPVRDAIAAAWRDWLEALETASRKAIEEEHIDPSIDPRQLAFEINALGMAANANAQLLGDPDAWSLAREAIAHRLEEVARPVPTHV